MRLSRAPENYRKTFRKRSYTLAFPSNRKTIDEHHVFMAFTVSNSVGKRLKMQRLRARENCRKTFRKTSYALTFSWSRKTIDEHHVFMAFTVSNSVGKRLENAAFARSGKLQKNIQENKLFIIIFLVLDSMR